MRIVMLGHSGVGKSTYMASVYGAMQKTPFDLCVRATERHEHNRLLKEAQEICRGIYPPATSQRHQYDFHLRHGNHEPIPFEWADYRGGDIYLTSDKDEVGSLHADIDKADGLLVFCDSTEIYRGSFDDTDLGHMISLLTNRLARQEDPMFVAVLLTKSDLVPEFNEDMIECFEGMIATVNASGSVIAGFVPVACGIRSANVVPALCFALYGAIYVMNLRQTLKVEFVKAQHAEMTRRSKGVRGFFDRLVSEISDEPTWEELANRKAQELATEKAELERLDGVCGAIEQSLDAVSWFAESKELEDYVAEVSQSAANALATPVKSGAAPRKRSFF